MEKIGYENMYVHYCVVGTVHRRGGQTLMWPEEKVPPKTWRMTNEPEKPWRAKIH